MVITVYDRKFFLTFKLKALTDWLKIKSNHQWYFGILLTRSFSIHKKLVLNPMISSTWITIVIFVIFDHFRFHILPMITTNLILIFSFKLIVLNLTFFKIFKFFVILNYMLNLFILYFCTKFYFKNTLIH